MHLTSKSKKLLVKCWWNWHLVECQCGGMGVTKYVFAMNRIYFVHLHHIHSRELLKKSCRALCLKQHFWKVWSSKIVCHNYWTATNDENKCYSLVCAKIYCNLVILSFIIVIVIIVIWLSSQDNISAVQAGWKMTIKSKVVKSDSKASSSKSVKIAVEIYLGICAWAWFFVSIQMWRVKKRPFAKWGHD